LTIHLHLVEVSVVCCFLSSALCYPPTFVTNFGSILRVGTPQENVKLGPTWPQCNSTCHYMLIHSSCTLTARPDIRWWTLCHSVVYIVLFEESMAWVMVVAWWWCCAVQNTPLKVVIPSHRLNIIGDIRCQEVSEGCETCWGHICIDEDHPGRKPQVGLIKQHPSCCHVYLHAVYRHSLTSVHLKWVLIPPRIAFHWQYRSYKQHYLPHF